MTSCSSVGAGWLPGAIHSWIELDVEGLQGNSGIMMKAVMLLSLVSIQSIKGMPFRTSGCSVLRLQSSRTSNFYSLLHCFHSRHTCSHSSRLALVCELSFQSSPHSCKWADPSLVSSLSSSNRLPYWLASRMFRAKAAVGWLVVYDMASGYAGLGRFCQLSGPEHSSTAEVHEVTLDEPPLCPHNIDLVDGHAYHSAGIPPCP